ncbi:DUF1566 domain-containing protein [Vibrio navarrensis]|uniref:Lcl C-terminal domain-containing protein n=1 Tax=Vibrio TaxID=662 RepID=UPI0006974876|nr:DUF1566 domain-containing protein [Vibrio navarrensis]MBE4603858.1 hypothetical protein [Vibrio navarrensis]
MIQLKTNHAKVLISTLLVTALIGCGGGESGGDDSGQNSGEPQVEQRVVVRTETSVGGAVIPESASVELGKKTVFTVLPDAGFKVDTVVGCDSAIEGYSITILNVTQACTVNVTFSQLPAVTDVRLSKGPSSLLLDWPAVEGATSYHVYYAREPGIEPDSYASKADGTWLQNVQPPIRISNLTPHVWHVVVTAVHPEGESAPSGEINAFAATQPLNDTGIDWCSNAVYTTSEGPVPEGGIPSNDLDCSVAQDPQGIALPDGQDGHFGRDAQALAAKLPKVGDGDGGFDFTKLDANGDELAASARNWSCVRDNVTGLIWEVKQPAGWNGLRDATYSYTWYNPDNSTNGGNAGKQSRSNCGSSKCNTQAFVNAVNNQGFCGASDWRLPSVNELLSIVHSGRTLPAIEQSYFPHTPTHYSPLGAYWSSSPYANASGEAWVVTFGLGKVFSGSKEHSALVRLVRAGQ